MLLKVPTAKEVADYLLDCTGKSLMAGDFDGFLPHFGLPHEVHTFDGMQTLHIAEDVRRVFDGVRTCYCKYGVTDMVRHCVEAEFHDDATIHSVHETRLLNETRLLQKPYPVFMVMRFIDDRWQIVRSEYAVTGAPDLIVALSDDGSKAK